MQRFSRFPALVLLLWGAASGAAHASGFEKFGKLTEREKTFLRTVFSGEEAKAVEYAQVAGINVNAIGGEPLSTWFYRTGMPQMGRAMYREIAVQRIVFERFKQNPNPQGVGESNLELFCNYAPTPQDIHRQISGTPEEKRALAVAQELARPPHINAMAAGFELLLRYGLRDKAIITEIFMGCLFKSAVPINEYYYDTVLSRMLRAGANINVQAGGAERPIEKALKGWNAVLVERLIRDGAEVKHAMRHAAFDQPKAAEPCGPPLRRTIYSIVFGWVRVTDRDNAVRMIRALASGGLSPLTKYGYLANDGSGRCIYKSFYDAVVDTGNLDYARAIKAAAEGAAPAAAPRAAAAPSSPSPAALGPSNFGAWIVSVGNDGRPVAIGKPANADGAIRELRIECVAGGRLEYAPVPASHAPVRSIWINGVDDTMNELRTANGRFAGPDAALLSKEFLTAEANAKRDGMGNEWGMEMTVNDMNAPQSNIQAAGFSQMRSHMLARCKS